MDMTKSFPGAILRAMRKAIQSDLFDGKREYGPHRYKHGGDLNIGKRKLARPFKRNTPIHIVLKSSQAVGKCSMLSARNKVAIDRIIEKQARKQQAKVHAQQNVGNHCHLMASFKTREHFKRFLRAVCGLIARHVLGAEKGEPAGAKFWDHTPFTRIVRGLRDFRGMMNYILKNTVEAERGRNLREGIETFERAFTKARKTGREAYEFFESEPKA
jgi:REP element-mobilizing transposase RayT